MKFLILFLLVGCTPTPLTEREKEAREYKYQETAYDFRLAVQRCLDEGGFIVLVNPTKRYPDGIENHPRPNRTDMRSVRCAKKW